MHDSHRKIFKGKSTNLLSNQDGDMTRIVGLKKLFTLEK